MAGSESEGPLGTNKGFFGRDLPFRVHSREQGASRRGMPLRSSNSTSTACSHRLEIADALLQADHHRVRSDEMLNTDVPKASLGHPR